MREVGERVPVSAPAATVSQIEKGERALKEPKIPQWANALRVREVDLLELWQLSQGLVPADGRLRFYSDPGVSLGNQPLGDRIERELRERPEHAQLYRLAVRITDVLRRMVPTVEFEVEPYSLGDFYEREWSTPQRFDSEYSELEAVKAAFVPRPTIVCYSREVVGPVYEVHVPVIEKEGPIARHRGTSVNAVTLDELIRSLTAPERERVRGYVEAIVEQRSR
jgi:hypothetical protein